MRGQAVQSCCWGAAGSAPNGDGVVLVIARGELTACKCKGFACMIDGVDPKAGELHHQLSMLQQTCQNLLVTVPVQRLTASRVRSALGYSEKSSRLQRSLGFRSLT